MLASFQTSVSRLDLSKWSNESVHNPEVTLKWGLGSLNWIEWLLVDNIANPNRPYLKYSSYCNIIALGVANSWDDHS